MTKYASFSLKYSPQGLTRLRSKGAAPVPPSGPSAEAFVMSSSLSPETAAATAAEARAGNTSDAGESLTTRFTSFKIMAKIKRIANDFLKMLLRLEVERREDFEDVMEMFLLHETWRVDDDDWTESLLASGLHEARMWRADDAGEDDDEKLLLMKEPLFLLDEESNLTNDSRGIFFTFLQLMMILTEKERKEVNVLTKRTSQSKMMKKNQQSRDL